VRVPLSVELRQHKQLHRMPRWLKGLIGGLVLFVSVGLHVAFLITAFGISSLGGKGGKAREQVAIEVREVKPKEEKKAEPPKPAEPEPPKPERTVAVRPVIEKAVQPEPQPKELPKAQPARVVGLSFESTAGEGEGGDGPAFAVGNTRMGETAKEAAKPKDVPKKTINEGATTTKPSSNAVATRLPAAGVVRTLAKHKKTTKPDYPPQLKAQGIETDVVVKVSIDETGKVTAVTIIKESPYPEANEAAKKSALADEFEPATRDGVPVPDTITYRVTFRLED
jgi:TonB family protein